MKTSYNLRKQFLILTVLLFCGFGNLAQEVGIGTDNPLSSLDIRGVNNNGAVTSGDGLIPPRVNSLAIAGTQNGQLVYLIGDTGNYKKGFYYWTGINWSSFSRNNSASVAESIVEPDAFISGGPGVPIPFINNNPTTIPDMNYVDIAIAVSGIIGNTTLVTIELDISHTWDEDLDIFLSDPTGKWLELSTDNGDWDDNYSNTLFEDAAPTNITMGTAPFTGSFKPEGTLTASGAPVNRTGTIINLAGFNGLNPNGNWTLRIGDDDAWVTGIFNSAVLNIAGTAAPIDWVSLGEVVIDYVDDAAIIMQSTYSGSSVDLRGVITALTRSDETVAIGTSAATLPGTVLNYASASPSGPGNMWVNTSNLARDVGLTNSTTYYYQLWRKGNIETPIASNETFNLLPLRIEQ